MPPLKLCMLAFVASVALVSAQDEGPDPKLTEYWTPQPPVVSANPGQPPSDAIVLFDGTDLDQWILASDHESPAPWLLKDDAMIVPARAKGEKSKDIHTKQHFGDVQLHLEWRAPLPAVGTSQGRGNSGIFFMDRYELQVLDCYENDTYVNGMTGSIYKQQVPLANACRAPGEWQTYDVFFVGPKFLPDGTLVEKAHITVMHNGVLVLLNSPIYGPTEYRGQPSYKFHTPRQPIRLQDHNNPVAYRNIWIRELNLP
jgi:hypothetical protein